MTVKLSIRAALMAALFAQPAWAESLLATEADRTAFGAELRALLLDDLDIVDRAMNPPQVSADDIYADDIAADLALIGGEAAQLFTTDAPRLGTGPVALAFVTGPDCAECAAAAEELTALLAERGIAARIVDVAEPEDRALLDRLGLDLWPSYVFPEMMVRGAMPAFVLARYLDE